MEKMNREEAIKIIEDFIAQGGQMFIDGCKGNISDNDLIEIAKSCLQLLNKKNPTE